MAMSYTETERLKKAKQARSKDKPRTGMYPRLVSIGTRPSRRSRTPNFHRLAPKRGR